MRLRSSALLAGFTAAAISVTGCNSATSISNPGSPTPVKPEADNHNVDVGSLLYPAKADVKIPPAPLGSEPIVIPDCTVQYEEKQQVAAEVDGKVDLLAVKDADIDPKDPNCVYRPRDVNKQVKYRLLKEGDLVKAGWEICFLDDQLVSTKITAAKRASESAQAVQKAASLGVQLSIDKLALSKKALASGGGSPADVLNDQITLTRFEENLAQALQTIAKADADFEEAMVMLRKHRITSSVNGIIRNVTRRSGEFVKAGDKILEIQATDVVRLEGNLDVQYAAFVKRGMPVKVEPAVPSAPIKSHALHRQEVTGIAVTSHPGRPLVVSVSADGTARVWDVTREAIAQNLPHVVPVRSVACSPPGAQSTIAITGADDGKVRVWDLKNPDKVPSNPQELADTHTAAVSAIAFSPDGKFFATAAGREVFVWDATQLKKLYTLPAEHRDVITCLHFTPQATLVTASKDRSLRVWKLGTDKAAVAKTIDHRAGAVDVLGVTKDGGRVVFDQDKNRLDLIELADKQTVGQVQNVSPTAAFANLAVFNRDDSLLLTAGGEGELKGGLQVWTVPGAGGRGSEAARLFTPARVGVTAAAFSPSAEHPFLVVGTEKGTVHLWKPPSDARKAYTGKVVYVDETDPRYVTVRVEMDNRELNLRDRSAATVIITPGK